MIRGGCGRFGGIRGGSFRGGVRDKWSKIGDRRSCFGGQRCSVRGVGSRERAGVRDSVQFFSCVLTGHIRGGRHLSRGERSFVVKFFRDAPVTVIFSAMVPSHGFPAQ